MDNTSGDVTAPVPLEMKFNSVLRDMQIQSKYVSIMHCLVVIMFY